MTTPETQVMNAIIQDAQDAIELATGEKVVLFQVKRPHESLYSLIPRVVCATMKIEHETLFLRHKDGIKPYARHIIIYLLYEVYKYGSSGSIGRELGGRHHSTILHSIRTCEELLETSKDFKNDYDRCLIAVAKEIEKSLH